MRNCILKLIFIFGLLPVLISCSSSDDSTENASDNDIKSPATIEYLCSATIWVYSPDKGIGKNESYENFAFYRIQDLNHCTIMGFGGIESSKYSFKFDSPTVLLKEIDDLGNEVTGGKTRNLTVYQLTKKNYNQKFLLIDGKQYMGAAGNGIDIK